MTSKRDLVDIHCTSTDLRKWADVLDQKWAQAKVGDDVPKHTIEETKTLLIRLVIDQERMYREQKGGPR